MWAIPCGSGFHTRHLFVVNRVVDTGALFLTEEPASYLPDGDMLAIERIDGSRGLAHTRKLVVTLFIRSAQAYNVIEPDGAFGNFPVS